MPRLLSNSSKSAINESRRPSSKAVKSKKSASTANRKCNLNAKNHDRLVGGADVTETEDTANPTQEIQEEATTSAPVVDTALESTSKPENGKLELSGGPCCFCVPGSTGDKKVDEMIDYVHQNLKEAGKALATLSENFEHELKLIFADILGRIQQWAGIVQNKLDLCKNDLEALRKELMARACEIAELRKKLTECEEREKRKEREEREERKEREEREERKEQEERKERGEREKQLVAPEVHERVEPKEKEKEKEKETVDEAVHAKEITKDKEVNVKRTHQEEEKEKTPRRSQTIESEGKVLEIICTDAAIQSMMKDKERMRREIELEAEIMRLRKENARIIKERAEYENAIQRALLRGVSSLNVEALRVLRCPPIPCCTPCAPCSTSATETIAVCKREVTVKGCVTHRSGGGRNGSRDPGSCTVKRPCASPCCSAGKGRKSASSNSMIFLLHQGDAENVCGSNNTPVPKVCGSPMMKKIEIPPCPRFR